MKLKEIKAQLSNLNTIGFKLPSGELVPNHFHVTEVGKVVKDFIDCGGVVRKEEVVNFQLWEANDYDHRLHPEKLIHIIELSQEKLGISDELEIEVEYQGQTIGKYQLDFDGVNFLLVSTKTACLAEDQCGIPQEKPKIRITSQGMSCDPNSGCC